MLSNATFTLTLLTLTFILLTLLIMALIMDYVHHIGTLIDREAFLIFQDSKPPPTWFLHTSDSDTFFLILDGKPTSGEDASWFHGQFVRTVLELR